MLYIANVHMKTLTVEYGEHSSIIHIQRHKKGVSLHYSSWAITEEAYLWLCNTFLKLIFCIVLVVYKIYNAGIYKRIPVHFSLLAEIVERGFSNRLTICYLNQGLA